MIPNAETPPKLNLTGGSLITTKSASLRCSSLCFPRPAPRSLSAPGGFVCRRSLHAYVSLSCPPRVLLQIMASSGPWFLVEWVLPQGRESSAPPLPGSLTSWFSLPPLLGHAVAVPATRLPPSPLVVMIPYS